MVNYFAGRTKEWLIERRDALQTIMASDGGSQTGVGISPGISHQFKGLSQCDLEKYLLRILYALFVLDPDNFDNPYASIVMTVSTVYPGYGRGTCCP